MDLQRLFEWINHNWILRSQLSYEQNPTAAAPNNQWLEGRHYIKLINGRVLDWLPLFIGLNQCINLHESITKYSVVNHVQATQKKLLNVFLLTWHKIKSNEICERRLLYDLVVISFFRVFYASNWLHFAQSSHIHQNITRDVLPLPSSLAHSQRLYYVKLFFKLWMHTISASVKPFHRNLENVSVIRYCVRRQRID